MKKSKKKTPLKKAAKESLDVLRKSLEALASNTAPLPTSKGAPVPLILGEAYIDTITGFKGKAVVRAFHLNGCIQVALQPPAVKGECDNYGIPSTVWFDEARLVHAATNAPVGSTAKTGGIDVGVPCGTSL